MAATPVLIPVEEYLSTVYRPDCDYIDGEVLERNMGEKPHARLQTFFARFFAAYEDDLDFETLTEQRLRIGPRRYRVPDVMLAPLSDTDARIVHTPPILCVEILSSRDRMAKIQERLNDYGSMGVQAMWLVDPWRVTAFFAGPDAVLHEQKESLTIPGTAIFLSIPDLFAELKRLNRRGASRS
jgi:Uma2 family endonuclease